MPVLFSLLVAGNSYENISRVGFINNFGLETAGLRENYMYPDNDQDYRYFLSQILGIFEASPAQIQRLSVARFCVTGDNTTPSTDLWICRSIVSGKCFFASLLESTC